MIAGIGIDCIEVARFRHLVHDDEFLHQVFSPSEVDPSSRGCGMAAHAARVFAEKESVLKALGCGLHYGSFWKDVEVASNRNPHLGGVLQKRLPSGGHSQIHACYASSKNYAVAFVLIE